MHSRYFSRSQCRKWALADGSTSGPDTEVGEQPAPRNPGTAPYSSRSEPSAPHFSEPVLHPAVAIIADQGHQRPAGRYDPVAQGRRHAVSVAGGAGAGIADAAGGPKCRLRRIRFLFPQQRRRPGPPPFPRTRPGPGPIAPPAAHTGGAGPRIRRRRSPTGERPGFPARFSGAPQRLKKRHGIPAVEPGKGPIQKTSVPGDVPAAAPPGSSCWSRCHRPLR